MLKAQNLSFQFNNKSPLILNMNLEIPRGEIIGLLGKSGSGKTTLGKILSGHLPPKSGEIFVGKYPLSSFLSKKNSYCPVQMLFQNPKETMNPTWTIRQIIEEGGPFSFDEDLKAWELSSQLLNRFPHELSGGELARVSLARILRFSNDHYHHHRLQYLVCDEITAMLDEETKNKILNKLLEIQKVFQIGILFISHEEMLLKKICHSILSN